MTGSVSRRDALKLLGTAAVGAGLAGCEAGAAADRPIGTRRTTEEDLRGIYVILPTPFMANGRMDEEDMASQVEWIERSGAHGVVWPQNSSGYIRLSTEQIHQGMEILARATRGRSVALVLGVQRDDTRSMVDLAKFADTLEPDMVIAMPPKVGTSLADYDEYYSALAGATQRPVMIQTIPNLPGVTFDTDLILDLASRYPHLGYVKEELDPVYDRIPHLIGKPQIHRVFTAQRGRHFNYSLRHGVDGDLSGSAMYSDAYARLWQAYRDGDWDMVRDIHSRIVAMLNVEQHIPGAGRYLLKRRGIFKSTNEGDGELTFTPAQIEHIEHTMKALNPYLIEPLT